MGTLDRLDRMAQYPQIVDLLEQSPFQKLSDKEKVLYIECLARISRGNEAERMLSELLTSTASIARLEETCGIVDLALGRFDRTDDHLQRALSQDPDSQKARMARMLLMLYLRNYQEAQEMYEDFNRRYRDWAKTYVFHLIGLEVYGATGKISKIGELYESQAARLKGRDKKQHENYRSNARLFKKPPQERSFELANASDKSELFFSASLDETRIPTLALRTKDGLFTIILDTGNRAGWVIHSRELDKRLKSKTGGMGLARIGAEEGLLHGRHVFTERLDLGDLSLKNLAGMYISKPRSGYPDANLNPLFIKDRVITLDFIKEELILRSEGRFRKDLDRVLSGPSGPLVLPWYGYEEAFIPVTVNGSRQALAMLETGAGDVALRLDFARRRQLPLEPAEKYSASGSPFSFYRTPVTLGLGPLRFERPAAEVWALDQQTDPLTGFAPDVIVGPDFFKGRWAISFDPFERRIILSPYSH